VAPQVWCDRHSAADDYRSMWAYCWFSERGAQRWVRTHAQSDYPSVKHFKAKMHAIGMKLK